MNAGQLHWIENGERVQTVEIGDGGGTFMATFDWKNRDYVWARAEVRSVDGELLGFTNPVSCGSKTTDFFDE
ncbi:hypothetical protein [Paenibacillus mendelii]|uniref:hypothetical protein n=1 Tax=Paenibacillus mendelii TaxID=206163 RepID=UPI00195D6E01|nr:hypothetical protein [Paenibacillus mendelii]